MRRKTQKLGDAATMLSLSEKEFSMGKGVVILLFGVVTAAYSWNSSSRTRKIGMAAGVASTAIALYSDIIE